MRPGRISPAASGQPELLNGTCRAIPDFLRLLGHVSAARMQSISRITHALHGKETLTIPHSIRSFRLAHAMGAHLGLRPAQLGALRLGGLLHDFGKITLPNDVLLKETPLATGDWEMLQQHPRAGGSLLAPVELEEDALNVVLYHHERFDGTGYPDRQTGTAIPLLARLFAIADSLDAITSPRPYRPARSAEAAGQEIAESSGSHFDPEMVALFVSLPVREWLARADRVQ